MIPWLRNDFRSRATVGVARDVDTVASTLVALQAILWHVLGLVDRADRASDRLDRRLAKLVAVSGGGEEGRT